MPLPPDAQPRPLEDFLPLLRTIEPVLLVGGQAVNLWAQRFGLSPSELGPFLSRDCDVLGERETLRAIAAAAGVKERLFPLRPPSSEIGVVMAPDAQGKMLMVEVLRYLYGVTNEEIRETVYDIAVRGIPVRVPGPVILLQAKIANAADLPQEGRQDVRHVRILARLMPAYLAELETETRAGRMTERRLVNVCERLLGVATSAKAVKVLGSLGLSVADLFPALTGETPGKVKTFRERRLGKVS